MPAPHTYDLSQPSLLAAVAVVSALAFVLLHELVRRRLEREATPPFHVALKISRLFASAALVAIGLVAVWEFGHLWPRAFIAPHASDSWLRPFNAFLLGHLVADLVWLGWGRWKFDSRPRIDLIAHHLLGIGAVATAFAFDQGYAVLAVAMTTEMMPVTTGIIAWARLRGDRELERRGYRGSLAVSLFWRLPLWLLVLLVVSRNAFLVTEPSERLLYQICIPIALALVALDSIWVRHFFHTLGSFDGVEEPLPLEEPP